MIYIPVSRTFLHKMWSPSPTPRGKQRVNHYPTGQFSSTDSVPYYLLSHPPQTLGDWKLREVKIAGVLSPRHNYQQRFRINFKVFWTADKIIREFILSVMLGKETPKREKRIFWSRSGIRTPDLITGWDHCCFTSRQNWRLLSCIAIFNPAFIQRPRISYENFVSRVERSDIRRCCSFHVWYI